MKSSAFYYSFLAPLIIIGLYILYVIATYSKSDLYETGVGQMNTLIGMIYITPVLQILLFLFYRKHSRDTARGILYGSAFWLFLALLNFYYNRGFVS